MSNSNHQAWFIHILNKVPLRVVLVVPFVIQVVTAVGLTGYLSFLNGQTTIDEFANKLMAEVSNQVTNHLDYYLSSPQQINQMNIKAYELKILKLNDYQTLGNYFWKQMQLFDVGYINYGSQAGEYIGVERLDKGGFNINEMSKNTQNKLAVYSTDKQGNRSKLLETKDYDHRQEGWYLDAVKAGKPLWTNIYQWEDKPEILSISSSYPIYDKNKRLLGVMGIDLILSQIGDFLRSMKVTPDSRIFIIERSGMLVGSSSKNLPYKIVNGRGKRITVAQIKDDLISAIGTDLLSNSTILKNLKKQGTKNILRNQKIFIKIDNYRDKLGLDWLIVVAIPEKDFMQQINYNNQTTIIMCILTLFIAVFLGIITTNWITQAILDINQAAKNIAQGELDIKINIDRDDEIGELADSFNYMAEELQKNFTEMRSLNDALFKSENRLNQLLESLPLGVAVHNSDGSVAYFNQVAKQLLGIQEIPATEREELASVYNIYITGTNSIYPMEQLPAMRALRGEKVVIDDLEIHVNNQITPVEARTTPIFDEQGNISYAIVAFQDISQRKEAEAILADYNQTLATQVTERTIQLQQEISERKKTELELEKAKEKAETANQAKSEFLANISHELRTPLNAILGYAQLMNQESSLTPEQTENLHIINSSGKHLLAIINDVLEMANIESGKIAINSNNFNLYSFVQTLIDIFSLNAEKKGLKVILEMGENVPEYIETDEMKLRQVLINLLGNAIKFTQAGNVILRVSLGAENILNLAVEDTGIGINNDELMKIFDAFEQAKKGVKSKEGTGLGLAISQKFIHLMGGEIIVESVVNQGSKFTFTLPIKLGVTPINQPEKTVVQPAAQTSIPNHKLRLLLAEDNLINQKVALKMLSRLGYEADVVNNGKEALLALQQKIYDIVLMDIQMPEMDGVTATKQIIVDFAPEKRPIIIAVTANAMQEDCDLYLSIGMSDFVPKPIQLDLLKSVLHRWENQLIINN